MSDPMRFADTGATLHDYATHFVVHCPKCGGKALIQPYQESWRLTCTNCHFVEKSGHWYGSITAYVNVKCRECRQQLTRTAKVSGEWKKLMMKCDHCGDEFEYDAHLTHHPTHEGWMCDRVLGLKLWLQDNFRDDVFWAYNYEHLEILELYVRAKLRERGIHNRGSKNSLMFSRLPDFIKKAKNREEILKLIHTLLVK